MKIFTNISLCPFLLAGMLLHSHKRMLHLKDYSWMRTVCRFGRRTEFYGYEYFYSKPGFAWFPVRKICFACLRRILFTIFIALVSWRRSGDFHFSQQHSFVRMVATCHRQAAAGRLLLMHLLNVRKEPVSADGTVWVCVLWFGAFS